MVHRLFPICLSDLQVLTTDSSLKGWGIHQNCAGHLECWGKESQHQPLGSKSGQTSSSEILELSGGQPCLFQSDTIQTHRYIDTYRHDRDKGVGRKDSSNKRGAESKDRLAQPSRCPQLRMVPKPASLHPIHTDIYCAFSPSVSQLQECKMAEIFHQGNRPQIYRDNCSVTDGVSACYICSHPYLS